MLNRVQLVRSAGTALAAGLGSYVFYLGSYSSVGQVTILWLKTLKMGPCLKGAAGDSLLKHTRLMSVTEPRSPSVMMPAFQK